MNILLLLNSSQWEGRQTSCWLHYATSTFTKICTNAPGMIEQLDNSSLSPDFVPVVSTQYHSILTTLHALLVGLLQTSHPGPRNSLYGISYVISAAYITGSHYSWGTLNLGNPLLSQQTTSMPTHCPKWRYYLIPTRFPTKTSWEMNKIGRSKDVAFLADWGPKTSETYCPLQS
jgi:hypothetical protein